MFYHVNHYLPKVTHVLPRHDHSNCPWISILIDENSTSFLETSCYIFIEPAPHMTEPAPRAGGRQFQHKLTLIYPKLLMFYHVNPYPPKVTHVLPRNDHSNCLWISILIDENSTSFLETSCYIWIRAAHDQTRATRRSEAFSTHVNLHLP